MIQSNFSCVSFSTWGDWTMQENGNRAGQLVHHEVVMHRHHSQSSLSSLVSGGESLPDSPCPSDAEQAFPAVCAEGKELAGAHNTEPFAPDGDSASDTGDDEALPAEEKAALAAAHARILASMVCSCSELGPVAR